MIHARIRFRHLNTLLEVARQKSVSLAAGALHVSQPAVTKTVRELEAILDTKLLEKDGRGIRITRQGEIFLRHAGASVAAVQQGVNSVRRGAAGRGPTVRVGALPTVSAQIMPTAIERYVARDLGGVRIVTGQNPVLLNQLRVADLDLVVGRLAAPDQMTGLAFEHLYSEQILVVVRKGHPLTGKGNTAFERIRDYTVLTPPPGSIIRPFVDRLLITNGVGELPRQVETVSDSFGHAFLRQTDAVWIISEGVVRDQMEAGSLVALPLDTSDTRGSVGLTTRADAVPSPQMKFFMSAVRDASQAFRK